MSNGVFALFGTKSYRSQDILTSYSDKFHMPYITISSILESMQGKYEVHMKPPLTRILRDLIFAKKWKNMFYVYDSDAGKHTSFISIGIVLNKHLYTEFTWRI